MRGCVLVTPQLEEIAKKLGITPQKAAILAGLLGTEVEYTLENIRAEKQRQDNEKVSLDKYTGLSKVAYGNNPNAPVISSNGGIIILNNPGQGIDTILDYLQGKGNKSGLDDTVMAKASAILAQQVKDDISKLIIASGNNGAMMFLNYFTMYRISNSKGIQDRSETKRAEIAAKSLIDACTLFKEYISVCGYDVADILKNTSLEKKAPLAQEFYSGAAKGSDTEWANQAKALGLNIKNYVVKHYADLSQEWKDKIEEEYQEVVNFLGRTPLPANDYRGQLVRRDMMQADKADAVFAIASIDDRGLVSGGTGYAAARGIKRGIPVFVFDQKDGKWKVWNQNHFVECSVPTLTSHAALIGTREIQESGKQAIKDVLSTFNVEKKDFSVEVKDTTANLSEEQKKQFRDFFGPYDEGGGADINDLFTEPLPSDVDHAISAFNWEGKVPLRSQLVWIIQHLKPEYKEHLSSLYPKPSQTAIRQEFDEHAEGNKVVMTFRREPQQQENPVATPVETESPKVKVHIPAPKPSDYMVVKRNEENPMTKYNATFNSTEKREAAEAMATEFSDTVSRLINNDLNDYRQRGVNQAFVNKFLNPTDEDRRSYIIANNERIVEELKKSLQEYLDNPASRSRRDLKLGQDFIENKLFYIAKILDNFELVLQDASIILERTENIALGAKTAQKIEDNESLDPTDNDNDPEENIKDGWMIKIREVDPRLTLSSRVKIALSSIPDGSNLNVFGKKKFISPDYAHAVLIDAISDIVYVEDFIKKDNEGKASFPALEKLVPKYPFVANIIRRLESNETLSSQFFTDFRKDFIAYTQVIPTEVQEQVFDAEGNPKVNEFGQPETKTVIKKVLKDSNKQVALDSALNELISNYDRNEKLDQFTIYKEGKVVETNRVENINRLSNVVADTRDYDFNWSNPMDAQKVIEGLLPILRAVGFNAIIGDLQALVGDAQFADEATTIMKNLGVILEQVVPENAHLINFFNGAYTEIATIIGKVSETMNVQSFRAGDKTFYSYSPSNYLNSEIKKLKDVNAERRQSYIDTQFRKYEWFFNHSTNQWRNYWLSLLESNEYVREHLAIDNMNVIITLDENGNKQAKPYTEWTEKEMSEAFILKYFSVPKNNTNTQFAWYNVPIYSDSPVVNFIQMPKFTGEEYQGEILEKMVDIVEQELWRIHDIEQRQSLPKYQQIANYDSQGAKFLFFPKLNLIPNFYEEVNALYKQEKVDEARTMIMDALYAIMDEGAKDFVESRPIEAEVLISSGAINSESEYNDAIEEYYWNQAYATSQIIQLATTDLAYYKNLVDFQKRFKEVYAAGSKLNTESKYGKKKERVLYLADNMMISNSIIGIEGALQQVVKEGRITKNDAKSILEKFGTDDKGKPQINAADAQAYRHIKSMRSILDMMGQWTPKMQEVMDKFEGNTWTIADFDFVWQTVKPFMFTQIEDTTGGVSRKVPHQHKNSEFLLLAMHSLIADSNIGKSPLLVALNKFMEENDIDVVMFESAVKAGGQDKATINSSMTEEELNAEFNRILASPTAIKEFDYEDYVVQQPTPEHLVDHSGIFGSQFRNLIVSDLEEFDAEGNPIEYILTSQKGEDIALNKQELLKLYQGCIIENLLDSYDKVKDKFVDIQSLQKALVQSIKSSGSRYGSDLINALQIVDGKFVIPTYNPSTSEKIQEMVTSFFKSEITKQMIKGGNAILVSNFGFTEELSVVYINSNNEEITYDYYSTKVNKINPTKEGFADWAKQAVSRGEIRLKGVECYLPAYSKKFYEPFLKEENGVEYIDFEKMPDDLKELIGYRIPTEDKYSMAPLIIRGFLPSYNGSAIMLPADITVHAGSDFDVDKMFLMIPEFKVNKTINWKQFKEDVKAAHRGYSDEDIEMFIDEYKQGLEIGPLVKTSEGEDLDASYPLKAFFEQYKDRWTTVKVEKIKYDHSKPIEENTREQRNNLIIDIARSILTNHTALDKFINPGSFDRLKRVAYITEIADSSEMLDKAIEYLKQRGSSLYEEMQGKIEKADSEEKKQSIISSYTAKMEKVNATKIAELLFDPDIFPDKVLKDIASSTILDPLSPKTFFHFHKQNMTGGALIGMYANNTTIFSKFQNYNQKETRMKLAFDITLDGVSFSRLDGIVSPHGERISKNCALFSAASVDNAKDPVLDKLKQNTDTANITALMLRLGMSPEEIGLLFTQPIIKEWCSILGDKLGYMDNFALMIGNFTKNKNLAVYFNSITKQGHEPIFIREILNSNFSKEDLLEFKINLREGKLDELFATIASEDETKEISKEEEKLLRNQLRLLLLMNRLRKSSEQLRKVTKVSRADSPNGAIATSIAGNVIQKQRVANLFFDIKDPNWTIEGADVYMENLQGASSHSKEALRKEFRNSRFPMLQAFYSLGIDFGEDFVKEYFIQYSPNLKNAADTLSKIASGDTLSEEDMASFFREYIQYRLTSLPLFGGDANNSKSADEQRDYYLSIFPSRFEALKAKHPEISSIGVIEKIKLDRNKNLTFERSARLTPSMKESFMRDFDNLNEGSALERQVAFDLFLYSFYKEGLSFGPNNFGQFFSTKFLLSIPSYVEGLESVRDATTNTLDIENFMDQFLLNHLREAGLLKTIYKTDISIEASLDKSGLGTVYLSTKSKKVMNRRLGGVKGRPNLYFRYKTVDGRYYLAKYAGMAANGSACYTLIPEVSPYIGTKLVGRRYNAGLSATELSRVNTVPSLVSMLEELKEIPVDSIRDVDVEIPEEEDTLSKEDPAEKYTEESNENKTNFCPVVK